MASLGRNAIDEDAASVALILQLIAQDFGIHNRQNTQDRVWDAETESSPALLSGDILHEVPHTDNGNFQSFYRPEQLPDNVTRPKITWVQDHSASATSLYQGQPSTTIQTTNANAINSNEMPKRSAETAGLSSFSFNDPAKEYSSLPSPNRPHTNDNEVDSGQRSGHETADGSEDASRTIAGTQNKRAKTSGSPQSFPKKEQPKPSIVAGSTQQAIIQSHGAESTQQHRPTNTWNSHATDMQADEGPRQSPSSAMASARSTILGGWGDVRTEHEEMPKVHGRRSNGHPNTASPHEPSQKTSTIPHRTKPWHSSEEHSEHAARASRPHDPFSSNHKDHLKPKSTPRAKKAVERLGSNLDPILDSDSHNDKAELKEKKISGLLSPYDDDWHSSTAQAQAAELAFIHESTIHHEGQTLTYIEIPWAGKPGWIESYVDDTALEYRNDMVGYGGGRRRRRGGPTSAQLEDNQRKRRAEEPVDVLVRDDETCDSIIEEMIRREERKRKGKEKRKGKVV